MLNPTSQKLRNPGSNCQSQNNMPTGAAFGHVVTPIRLGSSEAIPRVRAITPTPGYKRLNFECSGLRAELIANVSPPSSPRWNRAFALRCFLTYQVLTYQT